MTPLRAGIIVVALGIAMTGLLAGDAVTVHATSLPPIAGRCT